MGLFTLQCHNHFDTHFYECDVVTAIAIAVCERTLRRKNIIKCIVLSLFSVMIALAMNTHLH